MFFPQLRKFLEFHISRFKEGLLRISQKNLCLFDAVIEIHGCRGGTSHAIPFMNNIAEELSENLQSAGKRNAVVIMFSKPIRL